MIVKSRQQ